MSCRVLGRGVETACFEVLAAEARHRGAVMLEGHYIATPRNAMVADHYARLGFWPVDNDGAVDRTTWRYDLGQDRPPAGTIRIVPEPGT